TMLISPKSRMDILSQNEIESLLSKSKILKKYNEEVDSESAYEILTAKLEEAAEKITQDPASKKEKVQPSVIEKVTDNAVVKSMMRTAGNALVRSLLGALGLGGRTTRKRRN
ncbi:MAG: DUF853 family protein, partial [Chitinophagaceae bacterium]